MPVNDKRSRIFSTIAMSFSIMAIVMVVQRQKWDFDYYGALIGVLSLLVTILLGWNIGELINLRSIVEQNKRNEEEISRMRERLKSDFNIGLSQIEMAIAISYRDRNMSENENYIAFQSLYHWIRHIAMESEGERYSSCYKIIELLDADYYSKYKIDKSDYELLNKAYILIPNKEHIVNIEKLNSIINNMTL